MKRKMLYSALRINPDIQSQKFHFEMRDSIRIPDILTCVPNFLFLVEFVEFGQSEIRSDEPSERLMVLKKTSKASRPSQRTTLYSTRVV